MSHFISFHPLPSGCIQVCVCVRACECGCGCGWMWVWVGAPARLQRPICCYCKSTVLLHFFRPITQSSFRTKQFAQFCAEYFSLGTVCLMVLETKRSTTILHQTRIQRNLYCSKLFQEWFLTSSIFFHLARFVPNIAQKIWSNCVFAKTL